MREICFIDDAIPAISIEAIEIGKRLNKSNLLTLLRDADTWREPEVKSLVTLLVNEETKWNVSAFIHPNHYLNSIEEENYRPEVVIFDWEYPARPDGFDPPSTLLKILKRTFTIVYIFAGGEREAQIDQALQQPELAQFCEKRLFKLMKGDEDSHINLLKYAESIYNRIFSFRFGTQLRKATNDALDEVLVDLGLCDIDFVIRLLSESETEEIDIKEFIIGKVYDYLAESESLRSELEEEGDFDESTIEEFLSILTSKVTETINATDFNDSNSLEAKGGMDDDPGISEGLWSKRIYYQPRDETVRRGDIVEEKSSNRFYLVVSAGCDLSRFWSKNFGYIHLVPLYNIDRDTPLIVDKLRITNNDTQVENMIGNIHVKSFTDKINGWVEGPFICPFVPYNDGTFDFIGFPKEITSVKIEPPALRDGSESGVLRKAKLSYKHWLTYEKIATISEPFISPLIHHCFSSLSGYGTPDYPRVIKGLLKERVKTSLIDAPTVEEPVEQKKAVLKGVNDADKKEEAKTAEAESTANRKNSAPKEKK